jgi:O-glycosyl hydrolase
MSRRLSSQPSLSFISGETDERTLIQVDSQHTFQRIVGLGSSLEHSTCYNISRLPPARRAEVIESIVDAEKGIGMSLMRICIGTPDFTASPWYSYDDMPAGRSDPELKHFSIDKDREYVLPALKLALAKNPDLMFFASPWSPPGWMKTNDSLCGGRIDPRHFPSLARYLARFVEAYEAEGIRIHALTPQNEPGYFPGSYPTCGWTASQQRDFIRDHLGPEFQRRGTPTKIWCYDHNFNNVRFPMTILSDPEAARYVDGTAFHHYEGKPSAMTQLHSEFPDKHVYFAEGSVFGMKGARQIIEFLRHWACSYNAWVTIIDHTGQPNPGPHGCSPTCIVLNSDTLKLDYRFDYYMYGQFMRYIRPGAMRIQSDVPSKSLPNVAVRNRDGSIVLVVANLKSEPVSFGIRWAGRHATAQLDGESVATFRWLSH